MIWLNLLLRTTQGKFQLPEQGIFVSFEALSNSSIKLADYTYQYTRLFGILSDVHALHNRSPSSTEPPLASCTIQPLYLNQRLLVDAEREGIYSSRLLLQLQRTLGLFACMGYSYEITPQSPPISYFLIRWLDHPENMEQSCIRYRLIS